MKEALRNAYEGELTAAFTASNAHHYERAFYHLARAHVLSQRFTFRHARVHWLMLKLGLIVHDRREVFGQISRIIAALLFSRIWVPVGNTGRAHVNAMKSMPVPDELRSLLDGRDV